MSTLLFSLSICEIIDYFRNKGSSGVSISAHTDLLMILFADGIVMLSDTQQDAQLKLNILQEYCKTNGLTVNINKTEVVPFQRGTR